MGSAQPREISTLPTYTDNPARIIGRRRYSSQLRYSSEMMPFKGNDSGEIFRKDTDLVY